MEYVLFALRDSQTSTKARLGKLRHLDSLFFFLLLTALLSFQLFQQRQLREEVRAHRPDQFLDQLLQERVPQLEREVSQLRGVVAEMSTLIQQALDENKQLTLQLGRQLGLPLPQEDSVKEEKGGSIGKQEQRKGQNYEVIEFQPISEEDSEGQDRIEPSEEDPECITLPQEVISTSKRSNVCNYLQYLSEGQQPANSQTWSRPSSEQFRINTSTYTRKKGAEPGSVQQDVFKKTAEEVAKLFLVLILVAVVLMLTIPKRRRGKHTRSLWRDLWRKLWPEDRRRVKQEKEWLKEPQVLVL